VELTVEQYLFAVLFVRLEQVKFGQVNLELRLFKLKLGQLSLGLLLALRLIILDYLLLMVVRIILQQSQ
jgi:hypothetical protein